MKKSLILNKSYKPSHKENRMKFEGDVIGGRNYYHNVSSSNLKTLLKNRYHWMNRFISDNEIKSKNLLTTSFYV
jgi:hypothetical protein